MSRIQTRWLQHAVRGTLGLLFPPSCLACFDPLDQGDDQLGFCPGCRNQLQSDSRPVCRRCATRVPKVPGAVDRCASCQDREIHFDRALALGPYDSLLRELALRMKTDRTERLGHAMGRLMATQLEGDLRARRPDAVVPIPMHPWRRIVRGTNPPVAIATVLARRLGVPVFPRLLRRKQNIPPQVGLSEPARFRNVRGQMTVKKSYHLEAPHVLLVDDILTTGATCSEAARVLKRSGATEVTVVVAARTPQA